MTFMSRLILICLIILVPAAALADNYTCADANRSSEIKIWLEIDDHEPDTPCRILLQSSPTETAIVGRFRAATEACRSRMHKFLDWFTDSGWKCTLPKEERAYPPEGVTPVM